MDNNDYAVQLIITEKKTSLLANPEKVKNVVSLIKEDLFEENGYEVSWSEAKDHFYQEILDTLESFKRTLKDLEEPNDK